MLGHPYLRLNTAVDITIRHEFAMRVRRLRLARNLTQEQLAARAGLAKNFVAMIERRLRSVTLVTAVRISQALDVRLASLIPEGY